MPKTDPWVIDLLSPLVKPLGFSCLTSERHVEMFNHWEIMLFVLLIVVIFGSARLPKLMRDLGRSAVEFKKGMREDRPESDDTNSKDA